MDILDGAHRAGADALGIHVTSMPDYMVRDYRCLAGQTLSARGEQSEPTIYGYLDRINLGADAWRTIVARARELCLDLVAMCNDEVSFELAESLDVADQYVIAAAAFTEYEFVRRLALAGKPVLLRIGGATLAEIERVVDIVREAGNHRITLLHGIQLYPTSIDQLNLASLARLRAAFQCDVGLADHIDGDLPEALTLPPLAVAYGATVIEKHITTHRAQKLEDYEAALGIEQFTEFVKLIRAAESAIGDGTIGAEGPGAQRYRAVVRKRVVARRPMVAGQKLALSDVAFKRADAGIEVEQVELLLGRRLLRALAADEGIELDSLDSN
jgi:sialic acid synthase SpsE